MGVEHSLHPDDSIWEEVIAGHAISNSATSVVTKTLKQSRIPGENALGTV